MMTTFRKYLILPILLSPLIAFLNSCDKDEINNIPIAPKEIKLYNLDIAHGKVTLRWSLIDNYYFKQYKVRRYFHHEQQWRYEEIAFINSNTDTVFIDTLMPSLPYIAYDIIGELNESITIKSNKEEISRPNLFVYDKKPFDVVYSSEIERAFITEYYRKEVLVVNYKTGEYIGSIKDSIEFGYICVGDNGNGAELYAPSYSGKMNIYDAITLVKKADIHFDFLSDYNKRVYSATTNNKGKIYISVDETYPLRIIDRTSLGIVGQSQDIFSSNAGRLIYMPKGNSILEVTRTVSPSDANLYLLDGNGFVSSQRNDSYHGDYSLDDEVLTISSDESYFITSDYGIIYSMNLRYIGDIPGWGSDFETNEDASEIYVCQGGNEREILCYSYPELELIRNISTTGFPYKIHRDGDSLYCVSSIDGNTAVYSDIMLEKVSLK